MNNSLENKLGPKFFREEAGSETEKAWSQWREITDPELMNKMLTELKKCFYLPTIDKINEYQRSFPTATFYTPDYQEGKFIPTVSLIKADGYKIQVPIIGIADRNSLSPWSDFFEKMGKQIGNRLGALRQGTKGSTFIHTPNKQEVENSNIPIIGASILHRPYNHRDGIKYSIEKYGTFTSIDQPIPSIWQSLDIIHTSAYPELFYEGGRMDESLTQLFIPEEIAFFYNDRSILLFSYVPSRV